jgi:hypothetical protein
MFSMLIQLFWQAGKFDLTQAFACVGFVQLREISTCTAVP